LKELGCRLAQGFHFSRPLSAEAMSELLLQSPRW
jgi:EAL domain-containing protein (putative c-di-GMP-specific phosphodiesterase class I)